MKEKNNTNYVDFLDLSEMILNELANDMTFSEIRKKVEKASVTITEEEIQQYLDEKFKEEKEKIQRDLELVQNAIGPSLIELTKINKQDIDERVKLRKKEYKLISELYKFCFEPYTLFYYQTYINILRTKCLTLCEIYEDLFRLSKGEKISTESLKRLESLDIQINEVGKILDRDSIRLANAIVYNVKDLFEKLEQANNVETYFYIKIYNEQFESIKMHDYRNDSYREVSFPSKEVQILNANYGVYIQRKEFLELTSKQEQIIRKQQVEELKAYIDSSEKTYSKKLTNLETNN